MAMGGGVGWVGEWSRGGIRSGFKWDATVWCDAMGNDGSTVGLMEGVYFQRNNNRVQRRRPDPTSEDF